jgi:phospholipase D1/2
MVESVGPDDTHYFRSTQRAKRAKVPVASDIEHPPRLTARKEDITSSGGGPIWEHILSAPCDTDVVRAIQSIAAKNARSYEAVFQHTPRNTMVEFAMVPNSYTLPYPLAVASIRALGGNTQAISRDAIQAAGRDVRFSHVVPPALSAHFMKADVVIRNQQRAADSYGRTHQFYDDGRVHDVKKAIEYLKASVVGFFLLAPLVWGMSSELSGNISKTSTVDLANLSANTNSTMG